MNHRKFLLFFLLLALLLLTACGKQDQPMDGPDMFQKPAYTQITQEQAMEMMQSNDGHVIVDVRRQDEYDAGHIPGAVLIPNESIGTERPEELPDLNQIILIYCRSGNRSKQAAQKLFDMGYTNIYEFGGIIDWTGDVVTGEDGSQAGTAKVIWTRTDMPNHLRYDRMWEYSAYAETDDPEQIAAIVDAVRDMTVGDAVKYAVDDYTDILTFSFDDGTMLRLEFEEYNWVKDGKERYHVEGLGPLRSMLEGLLDNDGNTEGKAAMKMLIGETEVPVTWEDNESVAALRELLPLTVQMSMYGGFEQVGSVGQSITRDDHETITDYGDIVLYSGDQIVVFYGTNTWEYTRLGHIDLSQDELEELLGNGDVTITLMEDQ